MRTIHFNIYFVLACLLVYTSGFAAVDNGIQVVPRPQEIKAVDGDFELTAKTRIIFTDEKLQPAGKYLAAHLLPATGFDIPVIDGNPSSGDIVLALATDPSLGEEGYTLSAGTSGVKISASTTAGVLYGIETLRQMFPPQIESDTRVENRKWVVPGAAIRDWPRFGFRGFLLDSARHIQSIDFIKRTLDLMSLYKLNRFHWHLTDNQGWRIEIKKYPKLTEIGAWRAETNGDGTRYGGFYTQDQIRDLIKYAADRNITIIPEIEMPGHIVAALASYPQLGCTGGPYSVMTSWAGTPETLCVGNPQSYEFVRNVLDEVMDLFPSNVIHIGGDECPRERWHDCPQCQDLMKREHLKDEDALQNYFTHWLASYVESKGRRMQGWDEIMKGGDLPARAIVHQWEQPAAGAAAARAGHDVVYSFVDFMYFDYRWDHVSMAKVYSCDPIPPGLTPEQSQHILGLQANLWTENRPTEASCDDFIWPRMAALAEVGWSNPSLRDYSDFLSRMQLSQYERLAMTGLGGSEKTPTDKLVESLEKRGAIEVRRR